MPVSKSRKKDSEVKPSLQFYAHDQQQAANRPSMLDLHSMANQAFEPDAQDPTSFEMVGY